MIVRPRLIEDIFLSCSEPKRNVVEPSLVSVGTATMIHCRRCCWWWCVQDARLQDCYAQVTPGLAECCESACWRVLCKCMLDIRCCAITKSFDFWLRTVEKMGLILPTPWRLHHVVLGAHPVLLVHREAPTLRGTALHYHQRHAQG